jgi:hypothetical protein
MDDREEYRRLCIEFGELATAAIAGGMSEARHRRYVAVLYRLDEIECGWTGTPIGMYPCDGPVVTDRPDLEETDPYHAVAETTVIFPVFNPKAVEVDANEWRVSAAALPLGVEEPEGKDRGP